ncbi:hypothetical protein T484DRAFT_1866625 [Baffinella frigidus]|nr:hypothetical protein T484DRAFT_1866625 [Cryptophyta sp. CCMP2293]
MERKAMDSFKQHSNVDVSVGVLSVEALEDLWSETDCVITLSKGEGWGQGQVRARVDP